MVADGNDVQEMRAVTETAVERARSGGGPTLIEAKTYRVTPHSAATKTDLRPVEELDAWRARDPILRLARVLSEAGVDESRLEEIAQRARDEVESAIVFALASPKPEADSAVEDVYAPSDWNAGGRLA